MNIGKIWRRIMGIPDPQPPAAQPRDERGWSEDWQIGDLARCVNGAWPVQGPKEGDVLRVSGMTEGVCETSNVCISALSFEGRPQNAFWANKAFVKIRPDHSADEIETGIINKIKGVKV